MSNIKNLLEKMDSMSSAEHKPTGPKWPGYLKGTDSAKKSRSRMVGDGTAESVEESESFLKELNQVINSNPVKRDLFQEWQEYKQQQKINEYTIIDRDPQDPDNPHGWEITIKGTDGPVKLKKYSGEWRDQVLDHTGKFAPMDPEMKKMYQQLQHNLENNPYQPGSAKEFKPKEPKRPQDTMVPPEDPQNPKGLRWPEWGENETPISEYGAPGSGISSEPGAAEDKAQKDQIRAGKQQAKDQVSGLVAQLQGARAELAGINKQFPQGANPVEKAMSLQQMAGQKIGIKKNIENLSAQIAALRQQAI